MTTIEKIEKGIITLAEFTKDQQSFIRGIVKLSFNEGQEQALSQHDVIKSVCSNEHHNNDIEVWGFCEACSTHK